MKIVRLTVRRMTNLIWELKGQRWKLLEFTFWLYLLLTLETFGQAPSKQKFTNSLFLIFEGGSHWEVYKSEQQWFDEMETWF